MNLNLTGFPSMTVGGANLDEITIDDITDGTTEVKQEIKPQETTPIAPETSGVEKIENAGENDDESEEQNNGEPEEPSVDEYTNAEALVELLGTEGLQIYNEVPKGLTMEQFIKDIPEYVRSIEQEIRTDEAAKLGKFQEYYELMVNGISGEELKPAMMLEMIVDIDLDNPKMTSGDLIEIIKNKHLIRGLSEEEATALASIHHKDVDKLRAEAASSQEYISDYIEQVKQDVIQTREAQRIQEEQEFKLEQKSFVDVLNKSTQYTKLQKQEFFDIRYKRDQQISWVDDEGNTQRDFVTKYDVWMHQIQTDPRKLMDIIEYMNSGFDLKKAVSDDVANTYTKKLFAKLEGKPVESKQGKQETEVSPLSQFNSITF